MDNSFSLGGRDFKVLKIDAFKQFHIVRRMGPILADIIGAFKGTDPKSVESLPQEEQMQLFMKFAAPFMQGISKLSDADAELVLFGLLSAVEMKQSSGGWAKVATPSMLMIQDIELPLLMKIAGKSFVFNLSGFFGALPQ